MRSRKIICLIMLLITVILLLTSCFNKEFDKDVVTTSGEGFHLITLEPDGVIYAKSVYFFAPYYSSNGKLCHYVDGKIVEID